MSHLNNLAIFCLFSLLFLLFGCQPVEIEPEINGELGFSFDISVKLCDTDMDLGCLNAKELSSQLIQVYESELDFELGEYSHEGTTNSNGNAVISNVSFGTYILSSMHNGNIYKELFNVNPSTSTVYVEIIFQE